MSLSCSDIVSKVRLKSHYSFSFSVEDRICAVNWFATCVVDFAVVHNYIVSLLSSSSATKISLLSVTSVLFTFVFHFSSTIRVYSYSTKLIVEECSSIVNQRIINEVSSTMATSFALLVNFSFVGQFSAKNGDGCFPW